MLNVLNTGQRLHRSLEIGHLMEDIFCFSNAVYSLVKGSSVIPFYMLFTTQYIPVMRATTWQEGGSDNDFYHQTKRDR